MRRLLGVLTLLVFAVSPLMAANKVTVKQLDEFLAEQHSASKSDDAVATKLKEMELTEQLTTATMNSFTRYEPGPLTVTQIRILAVSSALLPPPATDLPTAAAPDAAAQAAIMAKAVDYASKVYAHLPKMTANKTTIRYQNGVNYVATDSGTGSNMAGGNLTVRPEDQFVRMLGQNTTEVQSDGGIEVPPAKVKQSDPASQNGQVSQGGAGLVLGLVLTDAAKGKLNWLRWQTVDGKQVAVFAFDVPKKQSQYKLDYCCFPERSNVGSAVPMGGSGLAGASATGNISSPHGSSVTWHNFKATPGYKGEIFIDPETGTILRLITEAELKPSDLVHREDIRVDYGQVDVDGKPYIVPVKSFVLTEVVPNGDSFVKFSTRLTLFEVEYSNYALKN
jgi:hypothetical protein